MDKLQIFSTVKLESSVGQHPNKQPFKGILCSVGSASTKAPCGSDGKQVVLSAEGSEKAIDTLKGMPLNVVWNDPDNPKGKFTGHKQTTVIGIIANAWIQDSDAWIEGYLFPQNYPKICASIKEEKDDLGFSYEILASNHETNAGKMLINEFTFIGACVLYKDSAAYGEDTQLIAAQTNEKDGNNSMDKELFQGMIDAMLSSIDAKIADIKASVDAIESKVEASVDAKLEGLTSEIAEAKEAIKAAAAVPVAPVVEPEVVPVVASATPAPTILAAGQTVVPNGDFDNGTKKTKKQRIAEVHAGTESMQEKMRKVVAINAEVE
jgi:hypothetical protein